MRVASLLLWSPVLALAPAPADEIVPADHFRRLTSTEVAPVDPCWCDTFTNGLSIDTGVGAHGCMFWHKNQPFLQHLKATAESLPSQVGRGYQLGCSPTQGGTCPADRTKCTVAWKKPYWQEPGDGYCGCTHYKNMNGNHPDKFEKHLCVTSYTHEENGIPTGSRVCQAPNGGYEARFGEGLQNWGCDHPGVPCNNLRCHENAHLVQKPDKTYICECDEDHTYDEATDRCKGSTRQ